MKMFTVGLSIMKPGGSTGASSLRFRFNDAVPILRRERMALQHSAKGQNVKRCEQLNCAERKTMRDVGRDC